MKIRIFANLPQSGKSTEEQGFGGGKTMKTHTVENLQNLYEILGFDNSTGYSHSFIGGLGV